MRDDPFEILLADNNGLLEYEYKESLKRWNNRVKIVENQGRRINQLLKPKKYIKRFIHIELQSINQSLYY